MPPKKAAAKSPAKPKKAVAKTSPKKAVAKTSPKKAVAKTSPKKPVAKAAPKKCVKCKGPESRKEELEEALREYVELYLDEVYKDDYLGLNPEYVTFNYAKIVDKIYPGVVKDLGLSFKEIIDKTGMVRGGEQLIDDDDAIEEYFYNMDTFPAVLSYIWTDKDTYVSDFYPKMKNIVAPIVELINKWGKEEGYLKGKESFFDVYGYDK